MLNGFHVIALAKEEEARRSPDRPRHQADGFRAFVARLRAEREEEPFDLAAFEAEQPVGFW